MTVGIGIVNGTSYIDALPAGVHLAAQLFPLLLVPNDLSQLYCSDTYDFMVDYASQIAGGPAYGGLAVLSLEGGKASEAAIAGARTACSS